MPDSLLTIVAVLVLGLYGTIGWVIIVKYRRTGNPGFLLLGAGVLLAPVFSWLTASSGQALLERAMSGEAVNVFPVSLVVNGTLTVGEIVALSNYGSRIAQGVLILLGVLLIGRTHGRRMASPKAS